MSHLATTESLWLPPPDARLIDPNKEKIETPVDERGLVLVGDLIDVVKETIDPDYVCKGMTSIHHIYWPEAWYSTLQAQTKSMKPLFVIYPYTRLACPAYLKIGCTFYYTTAAKDFARSNAI